MLQERYSDVQLAGFRAFVAISKVIIANAPGLKDTYIGMLLFTEDLIVKEDQAREADRAVAEAAAQAQDAQNQNPAP